MKNQTVFVLYKAKPGKLEQLQAKLGEHSPVLRKLGLLSERPETIIDIGEGCYMEIVEWASEESAQRAHDIPAVQEIWGAFGELADFVSFNELPKAFIEKPFAHATTYMSAVRPAVYSDNMLAAKDYKKQIAFYRDTFGLRVETQTEEFAILRDGESEQRLCITNGPSVSRFAPGVATKNLDISVTQLVKNGGKVLRSWEYPKMMGCNAEDPEGNEILLWVTKP